MLDFFETWCRTNQITQEKKNNEKNKGCYNEIVNMMIFKNNNENKNRIYIN